MAQPRGWWFESSKSSVKLKRITITRFCIFSHFLFHMLHIRHLLISFMYIFVAVKKPGHTFFLSLNYHLNGESKAL